MPARGVAAHAQQPTFEDKVWRPNLEPLTDLARLRIVQCHTDRGTARRRMSDCAASRVAHADADVLGNERYFDDFRRLAIAAPSIDVDTTSGYEPSIYYITDNQGSVIGLSDPNGTPRASYTYTPYGTQTATALNGQLPANPYGYIGGYTDTSTGLIHFGARYYNPQTGRWTQLDPSGQNASYAYAHDDPVNRTDPTGLFDPTCGIVTCTIYLNKHETNLLAAGAGASAGFLAVIPVVGPFLAAGAGAYAALAGYAAAEGECIKFKSTITGAELTPFTYTGSDCN